MNILKVYVPGETAVHQCDARVKILLLLVYSIAIFFADSWPLMAVFMIIPAVCAVWARLPLRSLLTPLVPVAILAAFALVFGVVNNPTPEGASSALLVAVRMVVLVLASFVVCLTTTSTQLLDAFKWFIGPLRHLHVPVDSISFTLMLALRFIPVIAEEFVMIRRSQQTRGADGDGLSLRRKFQIMGTALAATFIGLFRHADNVATAMDARCFGLKDK